MVKLDNVSFYGYVRNFSCFWGFSTKSNCETTVFRQYKSVNRQNCCCKVTVQLVTLQVNSLNSDYPANRPLLICVPSAAMKKLFAKNVEHNLEEATLDGTQKNVQLVFFVVLPVLISQQCPRLT